MGIKRSVQKEKTFCAKVQWSKNVQESGTYVLPQGICIDAFPWQIRRETEATGTLCTVNMTLQQ